MREWLVALYVLCGIAEAADDRALALRQEYNHVSASLDTLMRMNSDQDLQGLAERRGDPVVEKPLVLIFWADDEAEVFINGFRIGQTRLTPMQVEIPPMYLREKNLLQAHCWDTDKVESGFMAGLYTRDPAGGLQPVLVTDEGPWRSGEMPAEVRFYSNTQPDIPGAYVIWGGGLYGEVWLEAEFSARDIQRALGGPAVGQMEGAVADMQAHQVVSRIVQLQKRQTELVDMLDRSTRMVEVPRYGGYVSNRLAFTLGRAGRLNEGENRTQGEALRDWAAALPESEQGLVFRPPRQLKGVEEMVASEPMKGGGKGAKADRRKDYIPPPERSAGQVGQPVGAVVVQQRSHSRQGQWIYWSALVGLLGYAGMVGHRWWLLYRDEVWKR
jgi:hypothetical protein